MAICSQNLEVPSPELVCQVCGLPGHGPHFGVVTCRPCAAFFRRCVVLDLKYNCLKNKSKCVLDKIRRTACRDCRFKKCVKVGMTANNVQYYRDIHPADGPEKNKDYYETLSSKSSVTTENQLYRKSILCDINFDSIQDEVLKVFQSNMPPLESGFLASLSPLQKFTEGLHLIRTTQRTTAIQFKNRFHKGIATHNWKRQARNVAVLMMHSVAFRNLNLEEKQQKFRMYWKSVYRLERIQMSVQVFGEECVRKKLLVVSHDRAIQLSRLSLVFDGNTEDTVELALRSYKTHAERCIEDVARPLSQLKLSSKETAFLILNFVMQIESENNEDFLDDISNDLHEYYQEKGIVCYAERILKIMKIVFAMIRIHYDDLSGSFMKNN
ncbi:hypothetical protein GCK72_020722 [Caenorhabditis remanei]|uniref:Nuclear receptor domain-containing protein n=1 Tax=Caenorhabditis remanei TaxID=31234 RepID=A0A6A5GHZ5_CAERE|nr:hypothetical protein GCK72_020722 [Caenorhabditis remanei]KAF1754162.1 hypothetical protein GCK72_020722 [Caenorhabditis remanei]